MEVQSSGVIHSGLQLQAAQKVVALPPEKSVEEGAQASFSVQDMARTLKNANIDTGSFQAYLHGGTISFSLSQNAGEERARTSGTISLSTRGGTAQVSTGGSSVSISLQGLTPQASPQDVDSAFQNLQKISSTIIKEIRNVLTENPKADMTQVAASVISKYAQSLGSVLRYLMNFLFQLGDQALARIPAPAAKA